MPDTSSFFGSAAWTKKQRRAYPTALLELIIQDVKPGTTRSRILSRHKALDFRPVHAAGDVVDFQPGLALAHGLYALHCLVVDADKEPPSRPVVEQALVIPLIRVVLVVA